MKKQFRIFSMAVIAALFFASCAPTEVAVRPAPVAFVRPVRPSPAHIWVGGGYVRHGNQYRYTNGYWSVPRRHHRTYVEGYWRPARRGYVWVPGYWR